MTMLRWNTASNNVHSDENKFNQNQDLKYKKASGYELMYPLYPPWDAKL